MTTELNKLKMKEYVGDQKRWEKHSTIRSRPRRLVEAKERNSDFYPRSWQPLVAHPLVRARGEEAIRFILIQTMIKFMLDISVLETEMVNKGALLVAHDKFSFCHFPKPLRLDAFLIIIDEAYHAYVAVDFLDQVCEVSGVKALNFPKKTAVVDAMNTIKLQLPEVQREAFELIVVCIGEHILTKELLNLKNEADVSPTLLQVMSDHLFDEGRHATVFAYVLEFFWSSMPTSFRENIGPLLPKFLKAYFGKDIQIECHKMMLAALDFSKQEIQTIIDDTHVEFCDSGMSHNHSIVDNLLTLFQKCGVFEDRETLAAFRAWSSVYFASKKLASERSSSLTGKSLV